jgi:signal transduction histidine kinase
MSSRLSLLSQKLDLTFQQTDFNALIATTVADLKEYINVSLLQNLDTVPSIFIDQEQIHKVLENLLMNAYDAVGQNGQITVATKNQGNWVEVSVSDNGCGIAKEFIEKNLYRPFQTTKKLGMGIGLYHCKTIVEAHGGKINVESEEGKGTTFSVLLPANKV